MTSNFHTTKTKWRKTTALAIALQLAIGCTPICYSWTVKKCRKVMITLSHQTNCLQAIVRTYLRHIVRWCCAFLCCNLTIVAHLIWLTRHFWLLKKVTDASWKAIVCCKTWNTLAVARRLPSIPKSIRWYKRRMTTWTMTSIHQKPSLIFLN